MWMLTPNFWPGMTVCELGPPPGFALNAATAAASAAACYGGEETEAEGLAEGVVELLLLDEQFVGHVVLGIGRE